MRSNPGVEGARSLSTPLGQITVSADVVARIVGHTAAECYGVVGMSGRRVGRLLPRGRLAQGVDVAGTSDGLAIDLDVIVEYGLNLAEVAAAVRTRVGYEVERLTGLPVVRVEVRIRDVRRSA